MILVDYNSERNIFCPVREKQTFEQIIVDMEEGQDIVFSDTTTAGLLIGHV